MVNLYHDDGPGDEDDDWLTMSDQELLLPVSTVWNWLLVLVPSVPLSLSYLSTTVIVVMVVMMRMTMMLMVSPHG